VSVEVVEYDDAWPARFIAEADQIRAALGSKLRKIEHVGSTSVRGLAAKPVVDIAVSVESLDTLVALETLGYRHVDEWRFSKPGFELLAYEREDEEFLDHVRLRDYLRSHDEDRDAYGALKRGDYEDAKSDFVARLVEMLRRG
jgi:GrpB-like predicted nucleotidyltransferase (UPF0157 family)